MVRPELCLAASPQVIENVSSGFLPLYANEYPNVDVRLSEGIGADVQARGDALLGTVAQDVVPRGSHKFGSRLYCSVTFTPIRSISVRQQSRCASLHLT